jgi:hypothetical protein
MMARVFPGVDPYLEAQGYWPEFHLKFINYLQEAISDELPGEYEARIDERMSLIDLTQEEARGFRPDVAILREDAAREGSARGGGVATLEPVTIPLRYIDDERQPYIEIRHRPSRTLVTVIELLSPSNKSGNGRRDYLVRRNALLRQNVGLVELDFLVKGQRLPMDAPLPPGDCYAFVAPAEKQPDCDVYAWSIRRALPSIPIPLRAPDPPVWIDLGAVYDLTYERGAYARSVDYRASLDLPLHEDDRAWVTATAASRASGA